MNAGQGVTSVTDNDANTFPDVNLWRDQSSSGINWPNTTASAFPDYVATSAGMNYQPSLRFDGTNDQFLNATNLDKLAYGSEPRSIFTVANKAVADISGNRWLFSYGTQTATNSVDLGLVSGVGIDILYMRNLSTIQQNLASHDTQSDIPALGDYLYSAGSVAIAQNAGSPNTSPVTLATKLSTSQPRIGSLNGAEFWQGDIGEIVMYNSTLSPTELNRVRSYLALKYGISKGNGGETQQIQNSNATISAAVGQTLTASATGYITDITLETGATTANGSTGTLYLCNGVQTAAACIATPAYSQSVIIPTSVSTVFNIDLDKAFPITAASAYTFVLSTTSGTNINLIHNNVSVYAGGNEINTAGSVPAADLLFAYSLSGNDYLASDSTTKMWDATVAGEYVGNIFGL